MSNQMDRSVFVRASKGFRTQGKIDGPHGPRRAFLDRNSRTDCNDGETWTYHMRGASKATQDGRDPVYFVSLFEKVADAPAPKDTARAPVRPKVKQVQKPAIADNAEVRARALFSPEARDTKDLGSIGVILATKRAATDTAAIGIAGGIGCMERMLETNRADEVAVMATLRGFFTNDGVTDFDGGMAVARQLAEVRSERKKLKSDDGKYANWLKQAKGIKAKSEELPAHLTDDALAQVKVQLEERRSKLVAQLTNDPKGKVDTTLNDLERSLISFVDPWWPSKQEARAQVDVVMDAVADLDRICKERNEHLDTLAELVNQYEARLAELVA